MMKREAWHYNVYEGRPDWARELGRQQVISRQQKNMERRRKDAGAETSQPVKYEPAK